MSELPYLNLLEDVALNGVFREGRNGGTYGLFGRQIRFDLHQGFPLLTTKKIHTKSLVAELLWMLAGDTNVKTLQDQGVRIWNEWADEDGELGPIYGAQWRRWLTHDLVLDTGGVRYVEREIDQIENLIEGLTNDPYGRRHIVSAWNPADIPNMALPPCHCFMQFFVAEGRLSCQLYQRSADVFLGVPFNIASYALLTHLVAREVGLEVGEFVHTFGDVHLYANHVDQAWEQLSREPRVLPQLQINSKVGMLHIHTSDVEFLNYDPHPTIKAEVSV